MTVYPEDKVTNRTHIGTQAQMMAPLLHSHVVFVGAFEWIYLDKDSKSLMKSKYERKTHRVDSFPCGGLQREGGGRRSDRSFRFILSTSPVRHTINTDNSSSIKPLLSAEACTRPHSLHLIVIYGFPANA